MFCTTFYSYKGGVGRTLALANVATLFAQAGKKVLVVDFDLEAPGLTTLAPFSETAGKPGVVDFVHEYLDTGRAPDASKFIHRCEIVIQTENLNDGVSTTEIKQIDVMPAGIDDENYEARLNNIDWGRLYEEKNGFLLMEDLRVRWQLLGYDYVLIDSRTGHTDVGGICTRQLPDAVVAIFFPNEQNLKGLCHVVQGVRNAGGRPAPIELLFVASRVPRLDDEHGHLKKWLDRFQKDLEYNDDRLVLIEHYDSLMLLNQTLFVLERPNSGLSQQYRNLSAYLARVNPEDPDGALDYLRSFFPRTLRDRPQSDGGLDRRGVNRLERIGATHKNDGVVQFALARAYYSIRNLVKAAEACDLALASIDRTRTNGELEIRSSSIHRLRLRILSELGRTEEALVDAQAILYDSRANDIMLVDAVLAVASSDPGALSSPLDLPALVEARPESIIKMVEQLADLPATVGIAATIAEQALERRADFAAAAQADPIDLQIVLIAGGRFAAAVELSSIAMKQNLDLPTAFNAAMAIWGRDGRPDVERFRNIIPMFDISTFGSDQPNWHQCHALAMAVLKEPDEARAAIERARTLMRAQNRRSFSCWTYFNVHTEEFEQHLDAIFDFAQEKGPPPLVFTR